MRRPLTFKLVHGSTGSASTSRSPLRAYQPSPRSNGVSRRQKILRRVYVAVVLCTALLASPRAHAQTHCVAHVSANAAAFAGRVEPVHHDQLFFVPPALVVQKRSERREPGICNVFGKPLVFRHACHVQILDADDIEATHQIRRGLVQVVKARIRDACFQTRDASSRTLASAASPASSRQRPLRTRQLLFELPQMAGVCDSLLVRQNRQVQKAQVYTNTSPSLGERCDGLFDHEGYEVAASAILGYRDCAGRAGQGSRPTDLEPSELGDAKLLGLRIPLEAGAGIFGILLPTFAFELGVPRTFLEEVLVRGLQVAQRLLRRHRGDLAQPRVLRLPLEFGERGRRGRVAHAFSCVPGVAALPQSPVVDKPAATEGAGQRSGLIFGGVEAEFTPDFHDLEVYGREMRLSSWMVLAPFPPRPEGRGFHGGFLMRVPKSILTSLASGGYVTLQIPQVCVDFPAAFGGPPSPPPEMIDIPDDWIIVADVARVSRRMKKLGFIDPAFRPSVGKQQGFWYYSKKGWLAMKDELKKAFESSGAQRTKRDGSILTWKDFEAYADAFYKDMKDECTYIIKKKQAEIAHLRAAKKRC